MSDKSVEARPLPAVPFLKIPAEGSPYLEALKCGACGALYLAERVACGKCAARGGFSPTRLANRGTLYSYSIVCRSFPGIEVPYVSAIVDLEGGGTVKGNLIGVAPEPAKLSFGMPVEVVFKDALGRKDREGHSYLSYFFQPRA